MDRCFADIEELGDAETAYSVKQGSSEEYSKLKDFIETNGITKYKKYYIYSINEPGNKPYHFVAKFRSDDGKAKDLYLSHYSQGLNLLTLRDKEKNKPPSYPYYENEYVTLIKFGEFQDVPSAKDIYDTILLWWYRNDQSKKTTVFPGSCSGVVSCVIGKYDNFFNEHAKEKKDKYLQDLKKETPEKNSLFIETVRKRKSPFFRAINSRKSVRKSVKKVKKSTRKSVQKVKKSSRKSVRKVKKSSRKSVRKVKKSTRKLVRKVKKSSRKSVRKVKKSSRKSVRKVKSRK